MERTMTLKELNKKVDEANENGGNLYLSGLTSIPDGFNPTVGGYLDLSGLTSIPDGFNPTVGGYLDLSGLTSIPDGFNMARKLKDGDYRPGEYLYADGILTLVKRDKKVGEYTYYVGKIQGMDVISDGRNYAHCKSIKDGINELAFKTAKDRGAEQYRGIDIEKQIKMEDAVVMYRIITGACQKGTQRFVDSMETVKDSYTVREIIEMTKGQYGGETFRRFFED